MLVESPLGSAAVLELITERAEVPEGQLGEYIAFPPFRWPVENAVCLELVDGGALLPQAVQHLTHADCLRAQ